MKTINLKWMIAVVVAIPLLLLTSCKDDEPDKKDDTNEFQPVLHENFDYEVVGNDVNFTTEITGNVWVTVNDNDYFFEDQMVTVNLPNEGTYTFTCSSLGSGETLTSDPFDVVIAQTDLSFLDEGDWEDLTGGTDEQREWVLDVEGKVLSGPISFYGTQWDFVNGGYIDETDASNAWNWDNPGLDFAFGGDHPPMSPPGEEGYGVMRFTVNQDGYIFEADKVKEDPEAGTFSADFETATINITGASILRSYKPNAEVKVDPNCEGDDCETTTVDGMTGISDWSTYRIHTLTDTLLRLAVLRDQDVHGEGDAWLVYNFVAKDVYDAFQAEEFTFEEAPKTSITSADLVGTWNFADVPMGWIGYTKIGNQGTNIPARLFEKWNSRSDVVATLTSWGLESVDSLFTAQDALTYVFNEDGTCTLNGEANTYTVTNGIISFGSPLQGTEFSMQTNPWLNHTLTGSDVTVIDVNHYGSEAEYESYTPEGIWIGQKNEDKPEYKAFQLVKQ